jgi:kumamolisin
MPIGVIVLKLVCHRLVVCASALVFSLLCVTTVAHAQKVLHTRHVHEEVLNGKAKVAGRLPATQELNFDIVLPLGDPAGLADFLNDIYNPQSPRFHHYLTPTEFTAKFGPKQADFDALVGFAKANGFHIVSGSRDEMDLRLKAPVAAIESAFHVTLRTYHHPTENRIFFSIDKEPTAQLVAGLWHVSGLDNFSIPHALVHKKSANVTIKPNATSGSGPSASFLGSDMRAAYYGNSALTGAGQSLGLLEYYGTNLADVTTYLTNTGQTSTVPINLISTDGASVDCNPSKFFGCDDTEQTLDITQAIGMAPGLAQLNVYIGNTDTSILSAMTVVPPRSVTNKVDAQLAASWAWTPADPELCDPYFLKMAAQGQTFFAAAGDSGAYTPTATYVYPADDPYVISVGGTDLQTASAGGAYGSETAWVGSGGGYFAAHNLTIPSWQVAAVTQFNTLSSTQASTLYRNAPDVSANADYSFYVCANQQACTANSYGGTSFAAPMWAGYIALANQQALANQGSLVGFMNPAIYTLGVANTSDYTTAFHDVTSTSVSSGFTPTVGWDAATGWGSPNGSGLINFLAGAPTPTFSLSGGSVSIAIPATGSTTAPVTITSSVVGGFSYPVVLSVASSTLTGGASASLTAPTPSTLPAPGSGQATLTITVPSGATPGSYTVTVQGVGNAITQNATVLVTLTQPTLSMTDNPTSVSVSVGGSATTQVTTRVGGGFSASVALSATNLPSGVTAQFSSSSIASPGSGKSTVTFSASGSAAVGSYSTQLVATGGGLTYNLPITVKVVVAPSFTVSVSPTTLSVKHGSSGNTGTVTFSTAAVNGFNSKVNLSASGLPSNVTASFSPSSISGAGSSTVTFKASSNAKATRSPVTVTLKGTSGSLSKTATVSLTIT